MQYGLHTMVMAIPFCTIIEPHPTTESHREVDITPSHAGLEVYMLAGPLQGNILNRRTSIIRACRSRAFSIREGNGGGFSPETEKEASATSGIPNSTLAVT